MIHGASGMGFGVAFRRLVFALFRPFSRRFRLLLLRSLRLALLSALSRLRRLRFLLLALRFVLGLLAVAAVSMRQFWFSPFVVGFSYLRRFRVCVFCVPCASYSNRSLKINYDLTGWVKCRQKC